MIEPCIERDGAGEFTVVDGDGSALVCRHPNSPNRQSRKVFHRVDLSEVEQGKIRPQCGCKNRERIDWELCRRTDVESNREICRLCDGAPTEHNGGSPLASKLREMSIEEFDREVSG